MYTNDTMTQRETELMAQVAAMTQQVAVLTTALEGCVDGFGRPDGSSLLVRSQVYALLATLKREAQP